MKRRTLNPKFPGPPGRNRRVRNGIRNSALHPPASRVTATSQIPFQFSSASSTPVNWASHILASRDTATSQMPFQFSSASSTPMNWASHIAPLGLVWKKKPLR